MLPQINSSSALDVTVDTALSEGLTTAYRNVAFLARLAAGRPGAPRLLVEGESFRHETSRHERARGVVTAPGASARASEHQQKHFSVQRSTVSQRSEALNNACKRYISYTLGQGRVTFVRHEALSQEFQSW